MIQLFGCIAGTHVSFACPSEHSHDYFRYKKLHLLIVQAVCDYKRFIGVEYKRLGSFHNPYVFGNSSISKRSVKIPILLGTLPTH